MVKEIISTKKPRALTALVSLALFVLSMNPSRTIPIAVAQPTLVHGQPSDCGMMLGEQSDRHNSTSKAQAVTIPVTIQGSITPTDPGGGLSIGNDDIEDVYSFQVPAPPEGSAGTLVKISASFDNMETGDIDIALFRAPARGQVTAAHIIDASALFGNPEEFGPRCLPAGLYYLGVSAFDNANVRATNYTIQICVGGTVEVAASDSGLINTSLITSTSMLLVNAVSVCRSPATVMGARLTFPGFDGAPLLDEPITVIVFKAPAAGRPPLPPARPQMIRVMTRIAKAGTYFDVLLPENQRFTLNANEVLYVGMEVGRSGSPFPGLEVGRTQNSSFISTDGGATWRLLTLSNGQPNNLVFRGILQTLMP
jgi:hypothetical protein